MVAFRSPATYMTALDQINGCLETKNVFADIRSKIQPVCTTTSFLMKAVSQLVGENYVGSVRGNHEVSETASHAGAYFRRG